MLPLALLAATLGACACHHRSAPSDGGPGAPAAAFAPAGNIVDGVFTDARYGFHFTVPSDWTASPGRDDAALRLSLLDTLTGTRVELWAFSEPSDSLRRRADCDWTFVDRAAYRGLGQNGLLTTGTCTPHDPTGPRVYGWLLPLSGAVIQAEVHVPPDHLIDGRRRGQGLLRGLER